MQHAHTQHDDASLWEEVRDVLRRPDLSPAAKLAYIHLWVSGGRRPGNVRTAAAELAAAWGADRRAGYRAREDLEAAKLVDLVDDVCGVWTLYVYAPGATVRDRPQKADPQQALPLDDGQDVPIENAPDTLPLSAGHGANPVGADGPAEQPEPCDKMEPSCHTAPFTSDKMEPSCLKLQTTPTHVCDKMGPSCHTPPRPWTPLGRAPWERGSPAHAPTRDQSKNTKNLSNQSPNIKSTPSANAEADPAGPRQINPEEAIRETANLLLADSLHRMDALAQRVRDQVADGRMDDWIPERLAWAVAKGCLPERKLDRLCRYVARKRRDGEIRTSPGALCNAMGAKLASLYGFEWHPLGKGE